MTRRYKICRAANAYDEKTASDEAANAQPYDPISLTVQSQAIDADINIMMERFGLTGKMPDNPRIPTYGDFTNITDFRSAVEAVRAAHEGFMEIPAAVRARFDNDPQQLLEFCNDPRNRDEAKALGLLKQPEPPPAPPQNPGVAPPAQGGAAPPTAAPPLTPTTR